MMGGRERRSLILSDDDKKTTAYHEAGHALLAKLLPKTDPVHKVSIIPRGRALGVTMQLPGEDRHNYSKEFLKSNMVVLMGGRVAEELVLDQLTTGASNDIERATKTAHNMVCMWGMSKKLGPMSFGDSQEQVFMGKELIHSKDYGEDTAKTIDSEVRRFVEEAHAKATQLLSENREHLEVISMALLDRETITGADIDLLMEGKELPPMEKVNGGPSGPTSDGTPSGYTPEGKPADATGPGYKPVSEGGTKEGDDFILEEDDDKSGPDGSGSDGDDSSKIH